MRGQVLDSYMLQEEEKEERGNTCLQARFKQVLGEPESPWRMHIVSFMLMA